MRIIGGRLGGARFKGPPDRVTRPTPDRVREGLASILEARAALKGAAVLDLFAGTGALSFEALSRGAARAVAVDKDRRAIRAIAEVAKKFGIECKIEILRLDLLREPIFAAERILRTGYGPFDLVFADPPYRYINALPGLFDALAQRKILSETSLIVIEHATKQPPSEHLKLDPIASYRYGDTTLAILRSQGAREEFS